MTDTNDPSGLGQGFPDDAAADQHTQQQYPCESCGARLTFAPGTTALKCPYCGFEQQLERDPERQVREHSFDRWLARANDKPAATIAPHSVTCSGCGARTETDKLSDLCPFCGAAVVVEPDTDVMIAPEGVLPFAITSSRAIELFQDWVKSRWFAPNALRTMAAREGIHGTYLPHWTFDSDTRTSYRGQRGDYYWVTVAYTDDQGRRQTRQERRTRWSSASGQVERVFDDVLVSAVSRLPADKVDALEPWDLPAVEPYRPEYLAGYQTLRYEVEPPEGLERFKYIAEKQIERDCRHDIGGDEQRVQSMHTAWNSVTFKLLLLPVWLAAYRFDNRVWQVMINARTGEVLGDRPYSWVKITFAVLGALIVAALAFWIYTLVKQ